MIAFPTIQKHCKRCNKTFLTKDNAMEFCNHICEVKHAYFNHFNKVDRVYSEEVNCTQCGGLTKRVHKSETKHTFCNEHCRKAYRKAKRVANSKELFVKDAKKNIHKLPYEVLNKIQEKKRLFDDTWWNYNRNHERI